MIMKTIHTFDEIVAQLHKHGIETKQSQRYAEDDGTPITYFVAENRAFQIRRDDGTIDTFLSPEDEPSIGFTPAFENANDVDITGNLTAYEGRMEHSTQITDDMFAVTLTREYTLDRKIATACEGKHPDWDDAMVKKVSPKPTLFDLLTLFGEARFQSFHGDALGREINGVLRLAKAPNGSAHVAVEYDDARNE